MKLSSLLLVAAAALLAATPGTAAAQDEIDDLEGSGDSKKGRDPKIQQKEVREIVKGTYAKANVGGAVYLGHYRGIVSPGTFSGLGVGRDFVDRERMSLAAELGFWQGVHNGLYYELQPGTLAPEHYFQGDLRTYTINVALEASAYPHRRVGVGIRAGGGVVLTPLMMDEDFYYSDVVSGAWGLGEAPPIHSGPHPVVFGGPTLEYYTKLSHFSVGADVDVQYAIGIDLSAAFTGYMKYTF